MTGPQIREKFYSFAGVVFKDAVYSSDYVVWTDKITGKKVRLPIPSSEPVFHIVRFSAFYFNFQYYHQVAAHVLLLVFSSLIPFTFPSKGPGVA